MFHSNNVFSSFYTIFGKNGKAVVRVIDVALADEVVDKLNYHYSCD